MKKIIYFLFLFNLIFANRSFSQDVVVNGYFNEADPRDEWIELLVLTDNTDMRNWTLRDNNSSQTSWQTPITFQNIAFWNNMRAGTVIMIWYRVISSSSVSHATIDVNKADGYIELSAQDASYFSGGSFGSSPTWAGNSLNIAGSGDVLQLRNASGTHVHALGHASTAGADWTALPSPKLNHANSASSGDAIYVCPGASISDYNGPATGNAFTSKNNSTITFGLPNTCGASASGNTNYWNALREPSFSSQTITPTVVGGNPGSLSFNWTSATDPYPADNTIGYIILKNTVNAFVAPSDGTTYSIGAVIGTATVVAQTNNSTTLSYTDNSINSENCYYYRVYAFRYGTDNVNGNSYNASRGRAYNQTNFASVQCLIIVLPVGINYFTAIEDNAGAMLQWETLSSQDNIIGYTIERSQDGYNYEHLGFIKSEKSNTVILSYQLLDNHPFDGITYYTLKTMYVNGNLTYTANTIFNKQLKEIMVFPNPTNSGIVRIALPSEICDEIKCEIYDSMGKIQFDLVVSQSNLEIDLSHLNNGLYILKMCCQNFYCQKQICLIK